MATLQRITNGLPPRDQLALRLLGYSVQAGTATGDARDVVRHVYALSDAYLDVARDSWKDARAKAEADAGDADDEKEIADDVTQAAAA